LGHFFTQISTARLRLAAAMMALVGAAVAVPLAATTSAQADELPPGVTTNGYGDLLNYTHPIVFPTSPLPKEVQYTFRARRGSNRTHEGNDIICTGKMQPLVATAGGTISYITIPQKSWGYSLRVTADDGWTYSYLHINNDTPGTDDGAATLDFVFGPGIAQGARVEAGQVVAYCGDSGNAESSSAHLHFEMRDNLNRLVDPAPSLKAALGSNSVTSVTAPTVPPSTAPPVTVPPASVPPASVPGPPVATTMPGPVSSTPPSPAVAVTTKPTTTTAPRPAVVAASINNVPLAVNPPAPSPLAVPARLAGADRVNTSIMAAQAGWPAGSSEVVYVDANQFAEALPASVLAGRRGAPILQIANGWSPAVLGETLRLGAKRAWVVGSVPPEVDAALRALFIDVQRIGVPGNPQATATALATMLGANEFTAVLVNPERFSDLVAASSLAAARGWPVLYASTTKVAQPTVDAWRAMGIRSTVVVGGVNAIADNVVKFVPGGRRLAGADRYATSAAVVNEMFRLGAPKGHLLIVSGSNFPDAVSSGALSARLGAPTLLVDGTNAGADGSSRLLMLALRGQTLPHILGGPSAVSPEAEQTVRVMLGLA
jgi:putative cell wall-binding protein